MGVSETLTMSELAYEFFMWEEQMEELLNQVRKEEEVQGG